ncbi:MAG: nitrilase-related carbon-nitrogen hydrolase [Elusimicrobiota bacterium]
MGLIAFLIAAAWLAFLCGAGRGADSWTAAVRRGAALGAVYYGLLFSWMIRLPPLIHAGAWLAGAAFGAYVSVAIWHARRLPLWVRAPLAALIWTAPALIAGNPVRPFFGSVVFLTGLHVPIPLPLLQLARPFGETGLVFFLVALVVLAAQAFEDRARPRRAAAELAAVCVLLSAAWVWGATAIRRFDAAAPAKKSLRIACAQHDLPFEWSWRTAHRDDIFKTYERMALEAAGRGADMVLFPQYQIPEDIYREPGRWAGIARRAKAYIALGTNAPVEAGDYGRQAWVMNLVFSPEGKLVGSQIAQHPSPVGRPMVVVGRQASPVEIPGLGRVALLPCFDDVTSRPTRQLSRAGADVVFSLANDSLFKGTIHPRLHLLRSRLRAVESRTHFVRCIAHGFSAVIDPVGRVRDSLPEGQGILFAAW